MAPATIGEDTVSSRQSETGSASLIHASYFRGIFHQAFGATSTEFPFLKCTHRYANMLYAAFNFQRSGVEAISGSDGL
jgi:hypothetical protein